MTTTPDTTAPDGYGFAASVVTPSAPTTVDGITLDMDNIAADAADAARYAHEVRTFIQRFWTAPSAATLDLIVLWTIATHVRGRDARPFLLETLPLLMLGSTGPASGKSTVLRLIVALASRGEMVVDPTAPSLLNLAEDAATIGIDEWDTLIGAGAGSRNMRAHLLTSYTAGGKITRASGKDTRKVDVHYPIVTAGMLKTFLTHPTLNALRTRYLVCHCRPAGPDAEPVIRFRARHNQMATALREVIAAWGLAEGPHVAYVAEHIAVPAGLRDRDAELWEPILAVAECLGGDWPERARNACAEITQGTPGEDALPSSPGEYLLRDLSLVWDPSAARMATADLVTRLLDLPDSAWTTWLDADPENPAVSGGKHMSRILESVGVSSGVLKIGGKAVRGFKLSDLIAAGMPRPVAPEPADDDAPVKRAPRKRNPGPKAAPTR